MPDLGERWRTSLIEASAYDWAVEHEHVAGALGRLMWGTDTSASYRGIARLSELPAAQAFEAELKRRRQLGPLSLRQLTERSGPTLDQWITERWAPEHASTLAQSTRERYANVYAVHIAPSLDTVPLGEITVARLRAWQRSGSKLVSARGRSTRPGRFSQASFVMPPRERGDPR